MLRTFRIFDIRDVHKKEATLVCFTASYLISGEYQFILLHSNHLSHKYRNIETDNNLVECCNYGTQQFAKYSKL